MRDSLVSAALDAAEMLDSAYQQVTGRLWAVDRVLVPGHVRVSDGRVHADWRGCQWGGARGALDRFYRLRNDLDVKSFAARYGTLGLCAHGLPATHIGQGAAWSPFRIGWQPRCDLRLDTEGEPIECWLLWANRARALLGIAAELRNNRRGAVEDWRRLDFSEVPPTDMGDQRRRLTEAVNEWLRLGGVQPELQWDAADGADTEIRFVGGGTFGALAAQLMLDINRSHGWAICDWCGEAYDRRDRPRRRGRNFCLACNEAGRPAMLRKRDERARKRAIDTNGDTNPADTAMDKVARSEPRPE
jgi:hypothetical protein